MSNQEKRYLAFALIPLAVVIGMWSIEFVLENLMKPGPGNAAVVFFLLGGLWPLLFLAVALISLALTVAGIKLTFQSIRRKERFFIFLLATLLPGVVVVILLGPFVLMLASP